MSCLAQSPGIPLPFQPARNTLIGGLGTGRGTLMLPLQPASRPLDVNDKRSHAPMRQLPELQVCSTYSLARIRSLTYLQTRQCRDRIFTGVW